MTRSEIIEALGEINAYLYDSIKALEGTMFCEIYDRWRRAVTLAAHLLEGGKNDGRAD